MRGIAKDRRKRRIAFNLQSKRKILKYIALNQSFSKMLRLQAMYRLSAQPKNASPTRVVNRCVVTGRPKSVYKQFRLSRIMLKKLATFGLLSGIKKHHI